jgi:hypothetical protein
MSQLRESKTGFTKQSFRADDVTKLVVTTQEFTTQDVTTEGVTKQGVKLLDVTK